MVNSYIIPFPGAMEELAEIGIGFIRVTLPNNQERILLVAPEDYDDLQAGVIQIEELVDKYNTPTTLEILHTQIYERINNRLERKINER
jgi:hypothetical protein